MKDVMLDLETLGTRVDSVVLTIGATFFDPESTAMGNSFSARLTDLDEQVKRGRVIYSDTVRWWMEQSREAQVATFNGENPLTTASALGSFADYLNAYATRDRVRVWGNGAAFDNAILATLYEAFDMMPPWHFMNDRCYRTLKNLGFATEGITPAMRAGIHHKALDDATSQAKHAQQIVQQMRVRNLALPDLAAAA